MILKIMNMKETNKYVEENLYEVDSFLHPVSVAEKHGLILSIDTVDGQKYYAPAESLVESTGCLWKIDEIRKLSSSEMKKYHLVCPYRYKAHVADAPDGYRGTMTISAGFML